MPKSGKRADRSRHQSVQGAPAAAVGAESTRSPYPEGKLIDAIPGIVWRADAQSLKFKFVSSFAKLLLGYAVQRWTSEPSFWEDHLYSEDKFIAAERLRAVQNEGAYDLEYRMVGANGRVLWVRDIGQIVSEGGQDRELAGIIVGPSHNRIEEALLTQNDLWLRQMIDTMPQQIWSGLSDGTIDFCNARWRSEIGLSVDDIQRDGWQRILHPDDRDKVINNWRHSVIHGTPYEQQERLRMADGQYRWFLARAVPQRDEQGRVLRWYGTNTDIENAKRVDDERPRQERLWRAVFDNAYVGVAIEDASFRFVDVNSAFVQLTGYSLEELRGMTCLDITYEEDLRTYEIVEEALRARTRERFEIEKRDVRKDGRIVWVRVNGSTLPALASEPSLTVIVVEDITERKLLFLETQRQNERMHLRLDLTRQLIAKLDVSSVIESVLAALYEGERWEIADVFLPDQSTGIWKIYRHGGALPLLKDDTPVPIEGSASGWVYGSGQPIVFNRENLSELAIRYGVASWSLDILRETGIASGCILPLSHNGRALGVMFLASTREREISATELEDLQEMAQFAAAALDNALRFDELSISNERLALEKQYADEQIRNVFDFDHIIGRSKVMRAVLQQVQTVAPTDSNVLILGETGTGKELIARAIHEQSRRRDQPLVKVDCAAVPATLLESELFGYEKGAFTGAIGQKPGRLETADRGTLFLDEVGDLPLELQAKLLRVLQDRAFERLGSNRTRHLDIRVIAATNRDLGEMVARSEFRADLYYRLKVFPIVIPPLRDRPDDIAPLVWHYVHKYAHRLKKTIDTIPAEAMQAFRRYPWPGNVRELQHFMERSVVLTSGPLLHAPLGALEHESPTLPGSGPAAAKKRTMEEIEREAILEALRESNWVVGGPHGAARRLGIKRTTLASRMERLGISRASPGDRPNRSREDREH